MITERMRIISRRQALKQGLPRYFTGKPCKHGHVVERLVSNWTCVECGRNAALQYQKDNRSERTAYWKVWHRRNKEDYNRKTRKRNAKQRDKIRDYMTEWREQNRKRDRRYKEKWKNQNRGDVNAWTAKRRAQKIKATPPWADHDKIKEFYREARKLTEETGIPHHVDHIIPLLGDNVSGLHCEGNLRVIPATDNLIKGNEHNG